MVPLFTYNGLSFSHNTIFGSHLKRVISLGCVCEGKSSNRHTDMIPISLTLGNKGLFCAPESQLINSPLSEPEQANRCSASTELWMTCAWCSSRKGPFLTYFFFFHRQTGNCGQRRSGHGAAWGMEALPCVCPWRYSFWHTVGGLWLQTRQHDSLETQDQTERFAFRVLILLRNKLLLWCVGASGNSEDDEWSYSWATAQWPQKNIPVDVFLPLFTVRWAYELFEALLNVKL